MEFILVSKMEHWKEHVYICYLGLSNTSLYMCGYWVSLLTATLYLSIDWSLKRMKSVYLLKSRHIISQQKSYKNTIKHSLQFLCLFVLFGGELPFP